jgi:adenine-specific DNA methylase
LSSTKPRVLIEDWLPVAELGIESRRERGAASALPPLSFLHIWWARRPLVASAAVALAGILPAWSVDLADAFPDAVELRDEAAYRGWFLRLVGIWGDPIIARRMYDVAVATGQRIPNPFTYKQAFRNAIPRTDIDLLHAVLIHAWGELPVIADPTAGGGSIPWAASRLGLPVVANDLNGVAASVLKAGVEIPATRGLELLPELKKWGGILVKRIEERLKEYFPSGKAETVATYLYVNAIPCPRTGRLVPLLPDKWLRKTAGTEAAVRMLTEYGGVELPEPIFEVALGRDVDKTDASAGTIARGKAISPYDNLVIDGDWIKQAAQADQMKQILYAVAIRKPSGERTFRAPTQTDLDAIASAEAKYAEVKDLWLATGILPSQAIPDLVPKHEIRPYGLTYWTDMFTRRQALVQGVFVEEFATLEPEVREELGEGATDVLFQLALMQGKALNWNSRLSSWDVSRQKMRSVFDRHDFAFKWTFAEFEGARALFSWCLDQLIDAYGGIARLLDETGVSPADVNDRLPRQVTVLQGSGTSLALPDGAVTHVCMDPPYYDNVMYAELADYFYVWERRTLGRLVPDYFRDDLTDKDNEAVANLARFLTMGKRRQELADLDYETKMTSIFAECRRVLAGDGVLSVMFTHKKANAWDTLGMGLLLAGFTIETSWPVNTETEVGLNIRALNSAQSTIMLVCRKREDRAGNAKVYLDDIEQDVRRAARDAAMRFQHDGIEGVDLLLSTYGPTLSVISQSWPVYSSVPDEDGRDKLLRPEDALALAREEIVDLRRSRLVGKAAKVDALTDFVLMAWDTFAAREFPFDTARLLALAVGGLDVDALERAKVVAKSSGKVTLLTPSERVRRGGDSDAPGVRPEAASFDYTIDAVDTALYIAEHDGMQAAKRFLDKHGYINGAEFISTLQGLANAMPRTKVKGEWVVPEAGRLDTLCTLYFPDVTLPEATDVASLVKDKPAALFEME